MSTSTPQAFWLEQLGAAGAFNGWVFSQIAPHLGRNVLEVGCGTGTFTRMIAAHVDGVLGVDIEDDFLALAREQSRDVRNVDWLNRDVTSDVLPVGFDTIVMLDVLEHLPDDEAILARLRQSLVPGGRLIVKVPAHAWLYSPMDVAIGHHRRYSRGRLRQALTRGGFGNVTVWPFNRAAMLGWWFNGRVLRRTTPPEVQIAGFNRLVPILRSVEHWLPPQMGLSYFAVGHVSTAS